MRVQLKSLALWLIGLALMLACTAGPATPPNPIATPLMSPTPIPSTAIPPPTPTPPLPADWTEAQAGLWVREVAIAAQGKSTDAKAILIKIDPARYKIRVAYNPAVPQRVVGWLPPAGTAVVINAGFFQEDHTTAGLIISGGIESGLSFDQSLDTTAAPGMFSLTGGVPNIHYLVQRSYDLAVDHLDEAVQGFPILIRDGSPETFTLPDRAAWRTVVGIDAQGYVVLIHVSRGEVTLLRLQSWLISESGLGLNAALNLDGGTSTGVAIRAGNVSAVLDSVTRVPSVIEVTSK